MTSSKIAFDIPGNVFTMESPATGRFEGKTADLFIHLRKDRVFDFDVYEADEDLIEHPNIGRFFGYDVFTIDDSVFGYGTPPEIVLNVVKVGGGEEDDKMSEQKEDGEEKKISPEVPPDLNVSKGVGGEEDDKMSEQKEDEEEKKISPEVPPDLNVSKGVGGEEDDKMSEQKEDEKEKKTSPEVPPDLNVSKGVGGEEDDKMSEQKEDEEEKKTSPEVPPARKKKKNKKKKKSDLNVSKGVRVEEDEKISEQKEDEEEKKTSPEVPPDLNVSKGVGGEDDDKMSEQKEDEEEKKTSPEETRNRNAGLHTFLQNFFQEVEENKSKLSPEKTYFYQHVNTPMMNPYVEATIDVINNPKSEEEKSEALNDLVIFQGLVEEGTVKFLNDDGEDERFSVSGDERSSVGGEEEEPIKGDSNNAFLLSREEEEPIKGDSNSAFLPRSLFTENVKQLKKAKRKEGKKGGKKGGKQSAKDRRTKAQMVANNRRNDSGVNGEDESVTDEEDEVSIDIEEEEAGTDVEEKAVTDIKEGAGVNGEKEGCEAAKIEAAYAFVLAFERPRSSLLAFQTPRSHDDNQKRNKHRFRKSMESVEQIMSAVVFIHKRGLVQMGLRESGSYIFIESLKLTKLSFGHIRRLSHKDEITSNLVDLSVYFEKYFQKTNKNEDRLPNIISSVFRRRLYAYEKELADFLDRLSKGEYVPNHPFRWKPRKKMDFVRDFYECSYPANLENPRKPELVQSIKNIDIKVINATFDKMSFEETVVYWTSVPLEVRMGINEYLDHHHFLRAVRTVYVHDFTLCDSDVQVRNLVEWYLDWDKDMAVGMDLCLSFYMPDFFMKLYNLALEQIAWSEETKTKTTKYVCKGFDIYLNPNYVENDDETC